MSERRQLPPQIRRVELARRAGGKPAVRYQLTVDTGSVDGKRKQLRRRYATEKEARVALAEALGQISAGNYVHPSTVTVEQACADWLLQPQFEVGFRLFVLRRATGRQQRVRDGASATEDNAYQSEDRRDQTISAMSTSSPVSDSSCNDMQWVPVFASEVDRANIGEALRWNARR